MRKLKNKLRQRRHQWTFYKEKEARENQEDMGKMILNHRRRRR